ncbi:MAG: hypothetical protein WBL93_02885 [Lutisporaceae bacterium]
MSSRALQRYKKYHQLWDKIEKKILILAVMLFLMLYASQLLNFAITERGGSLLSSKVESLEGKAISDSQTNINTGTIEFTLISNSEASNIHIYLNGEYYTSFNKKSVILNVKNNDIIEFSGIKSEYPAKIKISSISNNILGMKLNDIVKVNKSFVTAGRIRLK